MSLISPSKFGDCSFCGNKQTYVTKRGREYYCQTCKRNADNKKQLQKAAERNQFRALGTYQKDEGKQIPKGTAELQRWFEARHKEMKGVCKHCGGKTEKDKSTYKCSIAHILPKAYFKSVATHPLNWIELCFYKNSCHTNYDQLSLDLLELNCFDEVIEKFIAMYPHIAQEERRRIPDVLLNYVKDNT